MQRIALIRVNLGNFEPEVKWVEQDLPDWIKMDVHRFTDANFPPRSKSMSPRLQMHILKSFVWEYVPGYDHYIWVDESMAMMHPDSAFWLLDKCLGYDFACFEHPDRKSIKEEYDYMKFKLSDGSKYIPARYTGEFIDEQYKIIQMDEDYKDDLLVATTAFVYANTEKARNALTVWWYHVSRYTVSDQLSFPYVVKKMNASINVLKENVFDFPYLTRTREKYRKK